MMAVGGRRWAVGGGTAAAAGALLLSLALPATAGEPAVAGDSIPITLPRFQMVVELSPPERAAEVVKVQALDRNVPQKMIDKEVRIDTVEARPDKEHPGKWVFSGLVPGVYDLCIETKTGKFEGYSLKPAEKSDGELTAEDRGKIAEIFGIIKTYEDEKRILDLGGNDKKAVALVELIRRGPTSYKAGVVTWRVELWRFEKLYGVWRKEDGFQVLRRFLVPEKEFAGWNWNFNSELGGFLVTKGTEEAPVKWTVPEKFDAAKGRAATDLKKALDEALKEVKQHPAADVVILGGG